MEDLLEALRVQRHDFLNHLQVISGLLQLKKYDRAQEYIKQVAEQLGRAGAVAGPGSPDRDLPAVAETGPQYKITDDR